MLNIDLNGKIALITGASRGIGKSCAHILSEAGAKVIINYNKNHEAALDVAKSIGENVDTIQADITDYKNVKKMMKSIEIKYGRLDILINNAGTTSEYKLEDLPIEDIQTIFNINTFGAFYCAKYALPLMKDQGGSIINISSTSMFTGAGGGAHYASSKSAMLGLTRNLAKDYGKYNIRTNALAITLVDTELLRNRKTGDLDKKITSVPLKRLCQPEEIGYMSAFLASNMASYINGEVITIDGGRTYA
ncbi:MAG: SDR family NAD(P)-dependent oxidoreductase [Eubacteriaceae bacterium]